VQSLTRVGIAGATNVALDYRVLLFTAVITALSGLLFALAPMLSATRANVSAQLKDGDRGGARTRSGSRATGALVAAEVALAVLLAAGAGLMVRTSWHLRHIDPGFETDGALAVQFTVPSVRYPNRDGVLAFYDGLLESLEARPGIERAGSVAQLPLSAASWSSQFQAEGWPESRVGLNVVHRRADAGYFDALEIPLVAGRMFGPEDRAGSPLVVLINETFAREHFPGEDPIGQRIAYDRVANANSIWYEIVGIVGDQNQVSPGAPARAEIFENRSQDWGRDNWIVVRSTGDPLGVLPTVREVLREADPLIPIAQVRPLREVWRTSMAREEFVLALLATFGALALLLAAVGVYAVTAQSARRRTREIGIRMALGAVSGDVVRLVLRQGLLAVILGIVGGLAATLVATRALASLLQGVSPNDPGTLGSVALMLLAVGALACWVPARRATRVDPVRSLQTE
jgi:putative ABC transport system permease protein